MLLFISLELIRSPSLEHYFRDVQDIKAINIIVASGPFTLNTGATSYDPLYDLLDVVSREKPDVLLLLGPFVDAENPSIQKG